MKDIKFHFESLLNSYILQAARYIEVSAKEQTNLDHVFDEAIEIVLSQRFLTTNGENEDVPTEIPLRKKRRNCILL